MGSAAQLFQGSTAPEDTVWGPHLEGSAEKRCQAGAQLCVEPIPRPGLSPSAPTVRGSCCSEAGGRCLTPE